MPGEREKKSWSADKKNTKEKKRERERERRGFSFPGPDWDVMCFLHHPLCMVDGASSDRDVKNDRKQNTINLKTNHKERGVFEERKRKKSAMAHCIIE